MNRATIQSDSLPADLASPRARWPIVVIALVTLAVFSRLCACDFSWLDDGYTIHHNPAFNPPSLANLTFYWSHVAYGLYMPVTYTVWMGLAMIGRLNEPDAYGIALNPWVFHTANVLIHVVAAVMVFLILRRLVKRDAAACIGALLFALHPVQVESVGWVSGLKDVLAGCFALIAIWRYIIRAQSADADRISPDFFGTIALILAMLSKPSAAMAPLIVMAIDRLILRRPIKIIFRSSFIWLMLMAAGLFIARLAQDVEGLPHAPLWARPLIAGDTITFYLGKLAYPVALGVDYGRRPDVVMQSRWFYFAWLVPAAIALVMWLTRNSRPWFATAGAIFLLAILPVSGLSTFLFQFTSTTADHYLYLAMLGPALFVAFLIIEYPRRAILATAMVGLFMLAARSVMQTFAWRDDEALFTNALEVNPHSALAHNNLGSWYYLHHPIDPAFMTAAIDEFRAAIECKSDDDQAYDNLANCLSATGDVDGAIAAKEKAIEIRRRWPAHRYANAVIDQEHLAQLISARDAHPTTKPSTIPSNR